MNMNLLYFAFMLRLMQIVEKHKVSNLVCYDDGTMFAVYYDEKKDKIRHLSISCTITYDVNGTVIYKPLLGDQEKVSRHWIFLEYSGEVKPSSDYDDVVLDKLVKKVQRFMGVQ